MNPTTKQRITQAAKERWARFRAMKKPQTLSMTNQEPRTTNHGPRTIDILPAPARTGTHDQAPGPSDVAPRPVVLPQATEHPTGWAAVKHYADFAGKFEHCKLACQVMAGFALVELHKVREIKPGQPKKNSNTMLELSHGGKWCDLVKQHAGVSEMTAWRWMEMARACKPRLKKLDGFERLRDLVSTPPSAWTADDSKLIETALHKITDGQTQMDFMCELGLCKKPQGSGATGGARVRGQREALSAEEEIALQKQMVDEDTEAAFMTLESIGARFTLRQDFQLQAEIAAFERYIAARRKWLDTPQNQRGPELIATLETLVRPNLNATAA